MRLHLNALDRTWLVGLLLLPSSFAQTPHRPPPAAPKDFAVMAWGDSPSDPEQLRGMREAGLNISGFCRVEDLERVRAAGLTCFVSDKLVDRDSQLVLPPDDQIHRQATAIDPFDRVSYVNEAPVERTEEWGFTAAGLRSSLAPYISHFGVALE
jgi:hypothetical protein